MYRSIRKSHIPPTPPGNPPVNPLGIWTFHFSCGEKSQGPKICSNAPRQGWIRWSNAPPPVHSSSEIRMLFGLKYPFPASSRCHKQEHDVCHVKYRLTNALCGMKHKIEATNQSPHPSGVVVKCPTSSTLRSVKVPPFPGKGECQMPGGWGMCEFRIDRYIISSPDYWIVPCLR